VHVDVNKPLVRIVPITLKERKVYPVLYEKLPDFCYFYGIIGHCVTEYGDVVHEDDKCQWGEPNNPRGVDGVQLDALVCLAEVEVEAGSQGNRMIRKRRTWTGVQRARLEVAKGQGRGQGRVTMLLGLLSVLWRSKSIYWSLGRETQLQG
jgi:hypothetical protein